MIKTAVITGTSRGLGLVITKLFLENGWRVYGLSQNSPFIDSPQYTHLYTDISDRQQVNQAVDSIGNIDLLINNAAVFEMNSFLHTADLDSMIDINLKGSIYVTKSVLAHMTKGSKIIFINSVAGLYQIENQSIYCASKHGLTAFAGILGKELKPQDINVASIHPGGINTSLWNKTNPYPLGDAELAMDPKTVADTILFVANSPNSVDYKTITMFPSVEWHG
jgi:NADP-dependent 3-hydroxy acid dehydrogenase YdfG